MALLSGLVARTNGQLLGFPENFNNFRPIGWAFSSDKMLAWELRGPLSTRHNFEKWPQFDYPKAMPPSGIKWVSGFLDRSSWVLLTQ